MLFFTGRVSMLARKEPKPFVVFVVLFMPKTEKEVGEDMKLNHI